MDSATNEVGATADPVRRSSLTTRDRNAPYCWLREDDNGGESRRSVTWVPFKRADQLRLEAAVEALEKDASAPDIVQVERGRYDVHLSERTLRAVYWEEPPRRVLRSLWFYYGQESPQPYEEKDSEAIELKYQRLLAKRERLPLLVPVREDRFDVRFKVMTGRETESKGLISWVNSRVQGSQLEQCLSIDGLRWEDVQGSSEDHYTACQEAVGRADAGKERAVLVLRGRASFAEDKTEDPEAELPEAVACLVFIIHGIGQYQRSRAGPASSFAKDVSKVRSLMASHLLQRQQNERRALPGRLEFLPLEWYEAIHVDAGIGDRLSHVTLESVPALRSFANFAIADIMVYQEPEWEERIHNLLQSKMARLYTEFKKRTPAFTGEVAVIGHSLGSVIMFDLMQKMLERSNAGIPAVPAPATTATAGSETTAEVEKGSSEGAVGATGVASATANAECKVDCCPPPRCFFAIGSPLGMFLSIRLSRRKIRAEKYFQGLDVRWSETLGQEQNHHRWRFYNVFHPDDPIAYRIEPLLNEDYADVPPRIVPHYGGLRLHVQLAKWWRARANGELASRPEEAAVAAAKAGAESERTSTDVLLVPDAAKDVALSFLEEGPGRPRRGTAVHRIDYVLQESAFDSINEFLSAINSHFAYWECEDLIHFIIDRTFDVIADSPIQDIKSPSP